MRMTAQTLCVAILASAGAAQAQDQNLVRNSAFLDVDGDGAFGDEWGVFGAAAVDFQFFGDGNPGHATLFGDMLNNIGGVFQQGIPATPGTEYTMTIRIQWESNWDARTLYGLEFYAADDETQLAQQIIEIPDELVDSGYQRHDFTATAPEGAAFVRPIVVVDLVESEGSSRAATVDNIVLRESSPVLNLNTSFGDLVDDGNNGDFWDVFGAAALDLDFNNNANPGHATLFADMPMNGGGVFQEAIPAVAGESYTLQVDIDFEDNWDANTFIGLEYYGADDAFQIGADEIEITEVPGAGYQTFRIDSVAPSSPFLSFVRPIVRFENAAGLGAGLEAATIDNAIVQPTSTLQSRLCADQNEDDNLTGADFNAFLTNFSAGDLKADVNQDGNLTGADFNGWLTAFSAGLAGPTCNP